MVDRNLHTTDVEDDDRLTIVEPVVGISHGNESRIVDGRDAVLGWPPRNDFVERNHDLGEIGAPVVSELRIGVATGHVEGDQEGSSPRQTRSDGCHTLTTAPAMSGFLFGRLVDEANQRLAGLGRWCVGHRHDRDLTAATNEEQRHGRLAVTLHEMLERKFVREVGSLD